MKTTFLTFAFLTFSLGVFGQGKITFGNNSERLFVIGTPVAGDPTGPIPVSPLPSGNSLIAQLYVGTSASSITLYTSFVLDASNWGALTATPGRMNNQPLTLDGFPANSVTFFNIVISDVMGAPGSPFVEGPASGAVYYGTSGTFSVFIPSSITYPFMYQTTPPANSTWLPGDLVINAVPEPSSLALAGLGLVLLLGHCWHKPSPLKCEPGAPR